MVVIPDMLSKKASVKFKLVSENIKGKEPKIATLNHARVVKRNACGKLFFYHDLNLIIQTIHQK